jgi:hypothetical protein
VTGKGRWAWTEGTVTGRGGGMDRRYSDWWGRWAWTEVVGICGQVGDKLIWCVFIRSGGET